MCSFSKFSQKYGDKRIRHELETETLSVGVNMSVNVFVYM